MRVFIAVILIGAFLVPFALAELDRKWSWWDLITGLIGCAVLAWMFL